MPRNARETSRCDDRGMPLSLDDMLPSERRLLAKLGGHVAPDVAIGCELGELNADELLTALTMRLRGLVEIVEGWRGSRWLMLTGTAQRLIVVGFGE